MQALPLAESGRGRGGRARVLAALLAAACVVAQAQTPAGADAAAVEVSGFDVTGVTLLPPGEVAAALEPFKGRADLARLQEAAAAVQRLYTRHGWGGVAALVPPQAVADGRVRIVVVEGKLAEIRVRGDGGAERVRASVPALVPGQTPRLRDIDRQLQIANESFARRTELLLQPGRRSGEIDAVVTLRAEAPQRTTLSVDNTGTRATGRTRVALGWQHGDLSGVGDTLNLLALTSAEHPSRVKVLSAGYRYPLPQWFSLVDVYASWADVDGGTTPTLAGDLSFAGRGRVVGVRGAHVLPRWGEADQRVWLALDRRDYLNQCSIAGLPEGACGPAGESVTVHPLAVDYLLRFGGELAGGVGVGVHHNLALGGRRTGDADFAAVRAGAKARFTALRANASLAGAWFEHWQWQLRGALQWSGDALVPAEQFGIGGAASVRGYEEREVTGDRGAFASFELTTPPLGGDALPGLHASAFVDGGRVAALKDAQCLAGRSRCALAAAGLALRAGNERTQLRVAVGHALRDGARTGKGDERVHVAFQHRF